MNGDIEPAGKYRVDRKVADLRADDDDAPIMQAVDDAPIVPGAAIVTAFA